MKVPQGMTEDEVLKIIEEVANSLAGKFKFGCHDLDDMKQYATIFALEGLERYDSNRGKLKTFLWTHVHNQLHNFKRNNYERPDKPCLECPLGAYDPHYVNSSNQCVAYSDKMACEPFKRWYMRNSRKKNLSAPIGISTVQDEHEDSMRIYHDLDIEVEYNTIVNILDEHIPLPLRALWIKMRNGITLTKSESQKILPTIHDILKEHGIDGAQTW